MIRELATALVDGFFEAFHIAWELVSLLWAFVCLTLHSIKYLFNRIFS